MNERTEGLRVLVVDDEKGPRDVAARALGRRGYRVSCAETGHEGLDRSRAEEIDVVLCDSLMPGIDGISFLLAIRACKPALPVIIVTGCATEENARRALDLGAASYVAKPYALDHLCSVIDRAAASANGDSKAFSGPAE